MSDLVSYLSTKYMPNFADQESYGKFYEMASIPEGRVGIFFIIIIISAFFVELFFFVLFCFVHDSVER